MESRLSVKSYASWGSFLPMQDCSSRAIVQMQLQMCVSTLLLYLSPMLFLFLNADPYKNPSTPWAKIYLMSWTGVSSFTLAEVKAQTRLKHSSF